MNGANSDEAGTVLLGKDDAVRSDVMALSSEKNKESESVATQHRALTVADGNLETLSTDGDELLGPSQDLSPVAWASADSAAANASPSPFSREKWLQMVNNPSASLYFVYVGILAAGNANRRLYESSGFRSLLVVVIT